MTNTDTTARSTADTLRRMLSVERDACTVLRWSLDEAVEAQDTEAEIIYRARYGASLERITALRAALAAL